VLSANVGRILTPFCLLVPFWLIWAFAGFTAMLEVWPAILVAGGSFAITQLLVSNLHGPWLVDIAASVVSMVSLIGFLLVWKPKREFALQHDVPAAAVARTRKSTGEVAKAWMPWVILSVMVGLWGTPVIKTGLDKISIFKFPVHGLHMLVQRMPPVVVKPTPEPAVFVLNWLSMTGTGIFIAAILSGIFAGVSLGKLIRLYGTTLVKVRFSLLTISAMLAMGFLTRFSGLDATMGLAFARTGALFPFFGTMLGWLGVALTGSDTSSNVLFGSLQKITAQQIGVQPALMASANSVGGVMGKMIDAQSIVVASTATQWYGHEATSCATCSSTPSPWRPWAAARSSSWPTCSRSSIWWPSKVMIGPGIPSLARFSRYHWLFPSMVTPMNTLYEMFKSRAEVASAEVHRFPDQAKACEFVLELLREQGVAEGPQPGAVWAGRRLMEAPGLSYDVTREAAAGPRWASARWTGPWPTPAPWCRTPRRWPSSAWSPPCRPSTWPWWAPDQLLPDLAAVLGRIQPSKAGYLAMITGPSRTADIERVLTIGVHGPCGSSSSSWTKRKG
jgi:hypothetical protein